ncbi:MAG: hypothetical protein KBF63_00760 [Rhodoferax sp.]|nr:hypothetical protein [Rhodoferax sp.]MBP9927774.1 hypothetical protein [Rhodoferax sp.]HQX59979.1 hypothetical protein [Burkholderiaceae bacterium]HQZ04886.1 hypothetical protein [Burkholderiaceae bacterium]
MKIRVSDLFSIADFRKLLFVGFASFVVRWIEMAGLCTVCLPRSVSLKSCQASSHGFSFAEGELPLQVIGIFDGDAITGTDFDGGHEALQVEESSIGSRLIRRLSNAANVFDLAQYS